jgi:hypothetical protein
VRQRQEIQEVLFAIAGRLDLRVSEGLMISLLALVLTGIGVASALSWVGTRLLWLHRVERKRQHLLGRLHR